MERALGYVKVDRGVGRWKSNDVQRLKQGVFFTDVESKSKDLLSLPPKLVPRT